MASEKSRASWYFLLGTIIIYIILFLLNRESFIVSGGFFLKILKTIIPVFIIVFVLMSLMNYFVTAKTVTKHLGEKSKIKGWFFAVIAGIISHGPIYMWYPLLAEAKEKGVRNGLLSCFLYNRAIKIPLLPIIILYFGIKYVLILTIVMIIMSIVQGIILEKIVGKEIEIKEKDERGK